MTIRGFHSNKQKVDCCCELEGGLSSAAKRTKHSISTSRALIKHECPMEQGHADDIETDSPLKNNPITTMRKIARRAVCKQPVRSSPTSRSSLLIIMTFFAILLAGARQQVASAHDQQTFLGPKEQFVDPNCKWDNKESITEAEKLLFVFKCDFRPLIDHFAKLMSALEPNGPVRFESLTDIERMLGVDKSGPASQIRLEMLNFYFNIERFFTDATAAINKMEFCTYPTIQQFRKLKGNLLSGSRLIANIYDLIAIEYHTFCLKEAIGKLPQIPQIVKEVVDIYMDGKDSNLLPDLNRPPGFNDEKKDEFRFDVEQAIKRNGYLEDVMDLTMGLGMSSSRKERVRQFKEACKNFLIEIEQRWQSMEMMNDMLSTEVNNIQSLNNFVLRALIPTKYADVCSQLSVAG